ncbi:MAG TPA: sensor domain-containing diguanylate cyclase [Planctomycetota bacterium]|nr:sensor domain-containing diguanylate cyclase [Planctomycetota bacterium]
MHLYLLGPDSEVLDLCKHAVVGWRLHVHSVQSAAEIPLHSVPLDEAALVTDSAFAQSHPEEMKAVLELPFLRAVVLCPDSASGSSVDTALGDVCEVIRAPTESSLRFRIGDWLTLENLTREGQIQARQFTEIASLLETSSQDMTALRQKVTFLDRQRQKLSSVLETMNMLSRLSQEINCLDLEEIITICVTKIPLLVNARYASLYLHNYAASTLELKRHNHGYRIDDVVRVTEDGKSAMCRALLERRILLIRDFTEYERTYDLSVERPNARNYSSRSCIIAPMLAGDRVVAVLNLADKRSGTFFDEVNDLPPIEQLSFLVGSAIRNWQLFQQVRIQAKTDAMTGFINHQTFFDELEKEVLRVRRYHGALSVMMVDVDNFKLINDVYGHQLGDHILTEIARIIRVNVRDSDVPARYGGDEFTVILAQADLERAKLVAERIREMVDAQSFNYEDKKLSLSLSIGVAQYRPGQSVADFVSEADAALYEAKAHGRNRVETTHPT